jgi:hypothetical protein
MLKIAYLCKRTFIRIAQSRADVWLFDSQRGEKSQTPANQIEPKHVYQAPQLLAGSLGTP